jgi:hypothetical protein
VLAERPADYGSVVVIVEPEFGCAVVEIERWAAHRIGPAEDVPRDVGAFEVLCPCGRERIEPLVKGLKLGSLHRRHVVLGSRR